MADPGQPRWKDYMYLGDGVYIWDGEDGYVWMETTRDTEPDPLSIPTVHQIALDPAMFLRLIEYCLQMWGEHMPDLRTAVHRMSE